MTADAFLKIENLTKQFDDIIAVKDLTLSVPRGNVLALLGPSGSGKTTTLRLLAGFERPDRGSVMLDGRDVTYLPPAQRRFGMVFQHYALFPHLNVGENVAFGLSHMRASRARSDRVSEVLRLVDLAGFEGRDVTELSGGQQQRVAVARALAPEPSVLCLDEPLSNLDPALRERTRQQLRQALDRIEITTVFVTHEQEEAFALGDRIAVLRDGALEQVGTAPELYEQPGSKFVATFVGRASVLPGVMSRDDRVRLEPGVEWQVRASEPLSPGRKVSVVVRPESLEFAPEPGLPGKVTECRYTGARAFFKVAVPGGTVEIEGSVRAARVGDKVNIKAQKAHAFPDDSP